MSVYVEVVNAYFVCYVSAECFVRARLFTDKGQIRYSYSNNDASVVALVRFGFHRLRGRRIDNCRAAGLLYGRSESR